MLAAGGPYDGDAGCVHIMLGEAWACGRANRAALETKVLKCGSKYLVVAGYFWPWSLSPLW
jgi:hypothetical protein